MTTIIRPLISHSINNNNEILIPVNPSIIQSVPIYKN
jgi:hypothetical protein